MYLVGIVGRAYYNKDNQKIIQTHEAIRKKLCSYNDIVCITLLPTEINNLIDIKEGNDKINQKKLDFILKKCDAFVLPGGTFYYNFDEYIINYAILNNKPLLAICLGFQTLCSHFAKNRESFKMEKNLNNNSHEGNSIKKYEHNINIIHNTILNKIVNNDYIKVNSAHHDFVNFEMNELIINAIADDGIIEGVELPNKKFVLGLQWHPEYLNDEVSKSIFNEFIEKIKLN